MPRSGYGAIRGSGEELDRLRGYYDDCGIRQLRERAEEMTVATVGCGKNKIVTAEKVEIQGLDTSDCFAKNLEYAEEVCDRWRILPAKHSLARRTSRSQTYDCSRGGHDGEQREEQLDSVETSLQFLATPLDLASEIVDDDPYDDPLMSDVLDAALAHLIKSEQNIQKARDEFDPETIQAIANTSVPALY